MRQFGFLILAMSVSAPALAENAAPALDPDQIICRTVSVTGSRLGASRRCVSRAQWAEDQRIQRANLDERTLRQVNPQGMNPGERGASFGRYVAPPGRGGSPN